MTCKGWRWYLERVLVNIKECSTQLQMSTVNCYVTTAIVTSGHLQPAVTRSGSRRLQPCYVNTAPRVSPVHMHKYFPTLIDYNVWYYWRLERSTDGGLVIRQCVVPLCCWRPHMLGCGIWTRTCSGGREGEERGGGGGDVDMIDFSLVLHFPTNMT